MDILRKNAWSVFSWSVGFCVGALIYRVIDSPEDAWLGMVVQFGSGVILGLWLGYHHMAQKLDVADAVEPSSPLLLNAFMVSWRVAIGWFIIEAVIENILTGYAQVTVARFPTIVFRHTVTVGVAFIVGGAVEAVVSHRIRPNAGTLWTAICAVFAAATFVLTLIGGGNQSLQLIVRLW